MTPSRLLFIIPVFIILASCRGGKPAGSSTVSSGTAAEYISRYKDIAISEMKRTGVPASITLAQGMIESNYGKSTLAREGNNHFGIKCHNGWTGATMRHHDDSRNECFRKYRNAEESFYDHSDFLRTGSRYRFLFDLSPDDYKGWARGLRKAGYATNPDYAEMLIRKIEELGLTAYDREAPAGKKASIPVIEQPVAVVQQPETTSADDLAVAARPERILENNRIKYIVAKAGETRDDIEKKFGLLRWELPKYNELPEDFTPVEGQILYLQPKRDKSEPGKNTYTTSDGETMYLVAQKFGIRLKNLYEYNRMDPGTEPEKGTKLWLRSMKPVF